MGRLTSSTSAGTVGARPTGVRAPALPTLRDTMHTLPSRLRPLLAAILCLLLAASSVLATEPAPTPADAGLPAPTADPALEPSVEPSVEPTPEPTVDPTAEPALEPNPGLPGDPTAGPGAASSPARPSVDPAPVPSDDPPSGQVIVILRDGADADAAAGRARGLGAHVERTFRNAVRAYAADVTPGQARRLAADPRVAAVVPDEVIEADEGLTAQHIPTGVRRVFGTRARRPASTGSTSASTPTSPSTTPGIDPTHTDLNVAGGYNCTSDQPLELEGRGGPRDARRGDGRRPRQRRRRRGRRARRPPLGGPHPRRQGRGPSLLVDLRPRLDRGPEGPGQPSAPAHRGREHVGHPLGQRRPQLRHTNNDVLHQAICRVVARGHHGRRRGRERLRPPPRSACRPPTTRSSRSRARRHRRQARRPRRQTSATAGARYDKDDTFANFSNYGADVDLIAPGKCIWSTKRAQSYGYSSGTSMAAPHVAGAAALYLASRPGAPPSEVRWALRYLGNLSWKTATDPDGKPDILLDVSRLGPLGDFAPRATLPTTGLVANEVGATWTIPLDAGRGTNFVEPITFGVAASPAPVARGHGRQHEALRRGRPRRPSGSRSRRRPRPARTRSSCAPPTGPSASARFTSAVLVENAAAGRVRAGGDVRRAAPGHR